MKINEELELIADVRKLEVGRDHDYDQDSGETYEEGWRDACDEIKKRLLAPFEGRTPIQIEGKPLSEQIVEDRR